MLGKIASAIGKAGGDIGAVDLVRTDSALIVRDITVDARNDEHGRGILDAGVVCGLVWGVISLVWFSFAALGTGEFPYSPELPE